MVQEPQRSLDGYGPEEMAIPEWRLLQKVGGEWAKELGAKPGQFYNTISDDVVDELNIVIVDILMGRAKWGEEIKNIGPECASMDARSNKSITDDDCSVCVYRLDAPWSADVKKRREMCCLNYTLLGIDLDHDYLPVMIRAHGISALPARQLITQLKMNRALRGDYHRAVVNIKSMAKDTPYGIAYSLHPKIIELITDEAKAEELKIESRKLLGTTILLPEARPEDERDPLGFTPKGTAFYSEEEKQKLIAEEGLVEKSPEQKALTLEAFTPDISEETPPPQTKVKPAQTVPPGSKEEPKTTKTEALKTEVPTEVKKTDIDLDF